MMPQQYRLLAGYNTWMNMRLRARGDALRRRAPPRPRRLLPLDTRHVQPHPARRPRLLHRFTGNPALARSLDRDGRAIPLRGLDQELYQDFDLLRAERARTDAHIEAWVTGLDGARLAAPIRYHTTEGVEHEHALWPALTHFFNHQTHHRGQVTTLLKQLGRDPGVTDLIAYARDHANIAPAG